MTITPREAWMLVEVLSEVQTYYDLDCLEGEELAVEELIDKLSPLAYQSLVVAP